MSNMLACSPPHPPCCFSVLEAPVQFLTFAAEVWAGSEDDRKTLPYGFQFCVEIWSSLLAEARASGEAGLAKVKHLLNANT